jgi:hypothetical protein
MSVTARTRTELNATNRDEPLPENERMALPTTVSDITVVGSGNRTAGRRRAAIVAVFAHVKSTNPPLGMMSSSQFDRIMS